MRRHGQCNGRAHEYCQHLPPHVAPQASPFLVRDNTRPNRVSQRAESILGHVEPMCTALVSARDADLAPYLPRLVRAWSDEDDGASRVRTVDGSLVSTDVSGFTALSERLAARGREGAEELVETISGVFDELIQVAERHGGDVLKFRGDALLLLFVGDRHPERACGAASDMQRAIESLAGRETSVGPVELRMACGVHSGDVHLFLTRVPQRELLVAGSAASRVFALEDVAGAGEVMLSDETAARVDPAWLGEGKDGGRLLRLLEPGASPIPPPDVVGGHDLAAYVPRALRDHLAVASGEAEHRQVTVAFVKVSGTDEADADPVALGRKLDALSVAVAAACERYGLTWLESDIDGDAAKVYLTAGAPRPPGRTRRRWCVRFARSSRARSGFRSKRASTAAGCSPATSAPSRGGPTPSWATPSISRHD